MTSSSATMEAARALLAPGEQLVWAERPAAQVLARSRVPQVIRGLLGLAVIGAFFWMSFLPLWPGGGLGLLLALFLAAAVLYCLWLTAAPLLARRAAAHTLYAVTDRRVIIQEAWPLRRLRSFQPAELDDPQVSPAAAGLGSVVFVSRKLPWWQRSAGGGYRIEAFYGIAEAQRVAEAIGRLRRAEPGGTGFPDEDS